MTAATNVPDPTWGDQGSGCVGKRSGREVSIDWFEASVKEVEVGVVFDLLVKHLGTSFGRPSVEVLRDDTKGFDARGAFGLRVRADRVGQQDRHGNRRAWCGVRLPGELCRVAGTDRVLDLADAMSKAGAVKVSRVDVALDDFDKTFSPRMFAKACVDGHLDDENAEIGPRAITRVRRTSWDWKRDKGGCFRLGSGSAPRLVRVYDKDRESRGRIPSTRIELQSRDEFSTALVQRLLAARADRRGIAEVFLGHLVEFIDLRVPNGPRSSSHTWARIAWWQNLVGDAKGISTPGRGDSEVWAWVVAMRRQFAGFLVVLLRAAGVDGKRYASAGLDFDASRRVVAAVRVVVGPKLLELSGEHEERLGQLIRDSGRKVAALRRGLRSP